MHIQMDNTTSDCKNSVTFAMCATGRCMRVHLFFMDDVGHTLGQDAYACLHPKAG
jgi:hypothetical protein